MRPEFLRGVLFTIDIGEHQFIECRSTYVVRILNLSREAHRRFPVSVVGFRLLMVVSLWQGPIAWGHQHAPDSVGMADHLARFHAGETDAFCLGWHWHVTLPGTGSPTSTDQGPPEQLPANPVVIGSAVSVCCGSLSPDALVQTGLLPSNLALGGRVFAPLGAQGFLGTFCPAHTAQQVLCRMSC